MVNISDDEHNRNRTVTLRNYSFLTLGIGSSFSVEWPPSLCVNFVFFQLWRDYRIISNPELFLRSGENCKDI